MTRGRQRRSRTRVRLTLAGWLYLAMATVISAAAAKTDAAVTLILLGAMFGVLLASAVLAWRSVRAVDVTRKMPDRLWQSQTVHLSYYLQNHHRWFACLGLRIAELARPHVEAVNGYCLHLRPRSLFRSGARMVALRRGPMSLTGVEISTVFPLSLVKASRRMALAAEPVIVWPARGRLRRQVLQRGAVAISSAAPSKMTGGQDEFFGLREFRPDDSPRLIHWRRSAGRPKPLIREMARPLPETLCLIVDTPADSRDAAVRAEIEPLLRFAATLADHALVRGYRVSLAIAGPENVQTFAPATGRAQQRNVLDALAAGDNTARSLDEVVAAVPPSWLSRSQVMLLSPRAAALDGQAVERLRARCGHLTVVDARSLPEIFEDHPLATREA